MSTHMEFGGDDTRLITVYGSNYQMGQQLGEQCRTGIASSLDLVKGEAGRAGIVGDIEDRALCYIPSIESQAPHLLAELEGLAEGAAISLADALLLQLRFEVVGFDGRGGDGCSSFAIRGDDGTILTGQNVDTVEEHVKLGLVVRFEPDAGPAMLMYTYYPGMIGYLGINNHGVSLFGNALLSPGWRVGFPRYLACRLALEQTTARDAETVIRKLHRASTINFLMTDARGDIRNLEQTVEKVETIVPEEDRMFHTNHYLSSALRPEERLLEILPDSVPRYQAGAASLAAVDTDSSMLAAVKDILRNHDNYPSSICRHRAEQSRYDGDQWMTVASLVAEPQAGRMHVCFGPPCLGSYATYELEHAEMAQAG